MPKPEDDSHLRVGATGLSGEPRTRILKHGNTFAVLDSFGDMAGINGNPDGLYHEDTRFLSRLELRLNGARPLLLSSNPAEDNSVLSFDLANPDTVDADGSVLHRELIYVNRQQFVWQGAYCELYMARNYDVSPHVVPIGLRFAADFADIFEVRGQRRPERGQGSAELLSPDTVALRYRGLDAVERVTTLRFDPAPTHLTTDGALFVFKLAPGEWQRFTLRVTCGAGGGESWGVRRYYKALREVRHDLRDSRYRAVQVTGSNARFNELAGRSLSDLYMLVTETEHGPYPFAGIPWYSTVFGRDGIITALMTLWLHPPIFAGGLGFFAAPP